jgi:NADH-ubiquinone oxidoreductase chain 5
MYLGILYFPLIGSLVVGFGGKWLGHQGAIRITTSCIGIAALLSLFVFFEVCLSSSFCLISLMEWFNSETIFVSWGLIFDTLTSLMLLVVCIISFLVHLYSTEYMKGDPHLSRFMSYLSLFTVFMLVLVTADNFVQLFVGWEGVGLSSYLLINFWYTRIQANKAAMKAMIVNRIGDVGIILAVSTLLLLCGSSEYAIIFSSIADVSTFNIIIWNVQINVITFICLLFLLGAIGKSAQIGLHPWLPDAMEGPTPVSALIHAATMVTAGVFVILRSSPIFELSPQSLLIVAIVGAITSFFAATTGAFQNDLKRVIAYSTCSQLGYMVFACGVSNYSLALFHLFNHAFFKALLFLSAGSVIHALVDEQDMRKMGGLLKLMPFTYVMICIGSLALMGFPFLTGFYSKDLILEFVFGKYIIGSHFVYWLAVTAAFFTSFYSVRLLFLTFFNDFAGFKRTIEVVHDAPLRMSIPLVTLSICSIFVGFFMKDLFMGLGTDVWFSCFFLLQENNLLISEYLPFIIKLLPLVCSIGGLVICSFLYIYCWPSFFSYFLLQLEYITLFSFFVKKWYFDVIYSQFVIKPLFAFSYKVSFKLIDRGFIELIGPLGLVRIFSRLSEMVVKLQSGFIYHYVFMMSFGLSIFLILFAFNFLTLNNVAYFVIYLLLLLIQIPVFSNDFFARIFKPMTNDVSLQIRPLSSRFLDSDQINKLTKNFNIIN